MHFWQTSLFFLSALTVRVTCLAINPQDEAALTKRASWTSVGCYADNVGGRALPNTAAVPGGTNAMTNELCQAACQAAGFTLAGTEYGGECWCGNTFTNGGVLASDGNAGCNMACKGNSAETCGGPNRLTAFSYGGSTAPPPAGTGKRGLGYNNNNPSANAVYANMFKGNAKVSWGYDWGYPSYGLDSSFEFVPMLWGNPGADQIPAWTTAVQTASTKHVLGFNEPDLTYSGSANLLPAVAAAGWLTGMQPFASTHLISTPNVLWNNYDSYSSGGPYSSRQWTSYFLGNCTSCHFDFAAIHYYSDCFPANGQLGSDWFISNVTNAHEFFKIPIWITEFQCYGSDDQQAQFLKTVLPWLDAQSWVQRYAYFGVFPGFLINSAGNGLSSAGTVYATV
ncbi:hypothetical protein CJF30_00004400 [Rutstroemia sp. NJR-2017a BBW]|nr:hypothetical protein CJF30_00004400 [Rutstroemia sp. NJR-2017a BBW]